MIITYKNIKANYEIEGQGPIIVWLHGFMENTSIWKYQKPYFKQYFTNIYIDLLGHGATQTLAEVHTMEDQALFIKYILDHLQIEQCTFIGHSMGGYITLAFLEAYPNYVSNLILLNSTSSSDTEEKKLNRDRAIKLVEHQKENFLRMGIINLFGDQQKTALKLEIDELIKNLAGISTESIIAALKGMKIRKDRSKLLKSFTGEKLIIAGKDDPVLPIENLIKESIATKSSILKTTGGHMSYIENYQFLNQEILNYLSNIT